MHSSKQVQETLDQLTEEQALSLSPQNDNELINLLCALWLGFKWNDYRVTYPDGHVSQITSHILRDFFPDYARNMGEAWKLVEQMTENGDCPALVNDDNGHWALALDGMQNVSLEKGPIDLHTTFFIEKKFFADTAPMAICKRVILDLLDE